MGFDRQMCHRGPFRPLLGSATIAPSTSWSPQVSAPNSRLRKPRIKRYLAEMGTGGEAGATQVDPRCDLATTSHLTCGGLLWETL